jgi:hypothetical protein
MDGTDFEWGGDGGDTGGGGGIDLSSLGLSGLDFENSPIDLSSILDGTIDTGHADIYSSLFAPDLSGINAENSPFDISSFLDSSKVDESDLSNLSPSEMERYLATQKEDYKAPTYENQDSGVSQAMMDEFNKNYQPEGGFGSQWQTSGSDRVMVNDDGTGIGINTETGETYSLSKKDVDKMVANNQIDTKGSGYVGSTGGNGYVPGGGKVIDNTDGTKTVITTDGKVLTITDDNKVIDTGKKVDPNNPKIETDPTKVISTATTTTKTPTSTTKTPTTTTEKPAGNNNNMLMALLALMAMMNKGGGSSSSGATIPSLQANRTQLPYGGPSGARPGAGGVSYFSPTTYTQKAAGGGMMYGGGGISDLGGYSDGGRLLKGPGDGVSDSIPATIGGKQPARLATGEFVVPARIVSELGNGSTDAGAQKLYAMMDRVQKARRKTKNVAADTKAHKYLPA